jgi:uncharacterized protein YgbK (DUF1537 family)
MIVVFADDLSGAAECAGAAVARGLSAEVQAVVSSAATADVVCIDSDSRSLPAEEAADRLVSMATEAAALRPAWVFKKCDSVLRGNVLAESRAVASVFGHATLLVVPANPSRGRVILDGIYRIDGRPLHETVFAHDPEHPRRTSRAADLLGGLASDVSVADATSPADIARHAATVDDRTLPVGAADFFAALLTRSCPAATQPDLHLKRIADTATSLLVCGSAASWQRRRETALALGIPVFGMPDDIEATEYGDALDALRRGRDAVIGIARSAGLTPAALAKGLGLAVSGILSATRIDRLLLEGGATAAAVVGAQGWTRLRVATAPATGVTGMVPVTPSECPAVLIKPGSYDWPAEIWPA